MTRAARSLFAFGIYVMLAAVSFLAAPAAIVDLLRLPPATDGWVRVVGLLALVIGAYDLAGSRAELLPYIRASVYIRSGFAAGTVILVASGQMPVSLLAFGALDAGGAMWTALALKSAPAGVIAARGAADFAARRES